MSSCRSCGAVADRVAGGQSGEQARCFNRPRQEFSARRWPLEWEAAHLPDKPIVNTFSPIEPGDTPWFSDGLCSFFECRDPGAPMRPGGRVIAWLAGARDAPEKGTGRHRHTADLHIVIMLTSDIAVPEPHSWYRPYRRSQGRALRFGNGD